MMNTQMNIGIHHFIQTYKLPDQHSPILRDPRVQNLVNKGVFAASILSLGSTVPQILKIWVDKNAEGVSALSWIGFTVSGFFWLTYGLIHRDKAIILSSGGGIIANSIIIIGTYVFS